MSDLGTALVFWPTAAIMLATGVYVFRTTSMARAGLLLLASLAVETRRSSGASSSSPWPASSSARCSF